MCKLAAGGSLEYKDAETKAAGFQIFRNEEHNITFGRAMSEFLVLKETSREAFSRLNQVRRAEFVASNGAVYGWVKVLDTPVISLVELKEVPSSAAKAGIGCRTRDV